MIPTGVPDTVPMLIARAKATFESSGVGYSDCSSSRKFAEAARAAFTSGPETLGMRSLVTRVPVG